MKKACLGLFTLVGLLYIPQLQSFFWGDHKKPSANTQSVYSFLVVELQSRPGEEPGNPRTVYWQHPNSPNRFYLEDQAKIWDLHAKGLTAAEISKRTGFNGSEIEAVLRVVRQKLERINYFKN